jgi:anionic cell wall polymer biosynthesis LytR-Cps2A-Psr (LCP) family protein
MEKQEKTPSKKRIKKIEPVIEEKIEEKAENEKNEEIIAKPKKSKAKWIILAIFFVILLGISSCYQYLSSNLNQIINTNEDTSLYKQLQLLLSGHNEPLTGENEDRINILLLGIGGEGHDGGNLTDTIMVVSVKPSTKQIALLSLPRDLAVTVPGTKTQFMKINRAYADGGMDLINEKIKEVTDLTMHYYVVLDFEGFQKIIDDLGGIDVEVENNFDGYYHISDCGGTCAKADGGPVYLDKKKTEGPYCIFSFTKGAQKMDGETALMYARIRHAKVAKGDPAENSDFARARRQQKVLEGLQKKAFTTSTLLNPIKISNILGDLSENLKTNLELWQMGKLVMLTNNLQTSSMIHEVIDNGKNGLVKDDIDSISGAYFAVPKAGWGKYEEIQKVAKEIFKTPIIEETNTNTNTNTEKAEENAKIIILNGTTITGLAKQTSDKLTALDLNVVSIGNNPQQNVLYTAIFDLTEKNPETLATLKKELNADTASSDFNKLYANNNINTNQADFIVVLGQDYE